MKNFLMVCSILAVTAMGAFAGEPPNFMKQTYPEQALKSAWAEYQAVYGPNGALSPKIKQLIALSVGAQIPCEYCVFGHTLKARKAGATEAEIKEALAIAALTRKWSTILNGSAYDLKSSRPNSAVQPTRGNFQPHIT